MARKARSILDVKVTFKQKLRNLWTLGTVVEQLRQENMFLREDLSEAEHKIQTLEGDIDDHKDDIQRLDNELSDLKEDVEKLPGQDELDGIGGQIDEFESGLAKLDSRIEDLENGNAWSQSDIDIPLLLDRLGVEIEKRKKQMDRVRGMLTEATDVS